MIKENIHQSLEVYYETSDSCRTGLRQYNFFELFYVLSGKGLHVVNGNEIRFSEKDLFLITPNDKLSFEIEERAEFIVMRFGQQYVNNFQWKSIDQLECLLFHASHISGSLVLKEEDREAIAALMNYLLQNLQHHSLYHEDLIGHLVNAVIVIAARNITSLQPKDLLQHPDEKILEIIHYIQTNIQQPDLLRLDIMADKFGLSKSYIGSYFRKQSGESIQQYITSYRIRLIEHRLQFSDKRINEIAREFGFVDESHVSKFFKRHRGVGLKSYRTIRREEKLHDTASNLSR